MALAQVLKQEYLQTILELIFGIELLKIIIIYINIHCFARFAHIGFLYWCDI